MSTAAFSLRRVRFQPVFTTEIQPVAFWIGGPALSRRTIVDRRHTTVDTGRSNPGDRAARRLHRREVIWAIYIVSKSFHT